MKPCDYCDEPGGLKTYENQVLMPINGKVECIDHCIHKIVAALNAGGVETVACCCGHGKVKGNIVLSDGRVMIILPKTPKDTDTWCEAVGAPPYDPNSCDNP